MKLLKKLPILLALILVLPGCEDFLTENPKGFASSENLFKSKSGITGVLYGVYQGIRSLYWRSEYVLPYGATSDEIYLTSTTVSHVELQNFVFTPTNGELGRIWTANTRGISRANQLIEGVQGYPDAAFVKRILAEAKFLRAWLYFGQVRSYGAVPLVTEYENAELFPKAATIPEIYALIVADLKEAEQGLPGWKEIPGEKGRATRGAAKAVLAKVYLTMATTPETADLKFFELAAAKLKEIIDTEGYGLQPHYADAFLPANEGGKEDIFAFQFQANAAGAYTGHIQAQFSPNPDTYGQRGLNRLAIANDLYDALEPRDERRKIMIRGTYTALKFNESGTVVDSTKYKTPNNRPYTQKYRDPNWGRFVYNNHDTNLPFIRYSDVLLMYSEAVNELAGATAEAYRGIDQVRARSNASPLPRGLGMVELRQAIRNERKYELHGEGHRWFDLVRWGTLKEAVEATKPGVTVTLPKHRFFPIPQTEVDANPNLNQNPGY